MKRIEEKVLRFIDSNKLINKNEKILVALSGGADSVFALYFLNKFKRRLGISVAAVHLNHSLREDDSLRDEQFCKEYCQNLNIHFFSKSLSIKVISKKNKTSIEETGRIERYKYFNELCSEYKFDKIVTAHHKDDNAETILMNLFRGTGVRGYTGIPFKRGKVIRPILVLSKQEIVSYLSTYKINYVTDISNFSDDYVRNLIRNQIVPIIEGKINPRWSDSVFNSSQVINNYLELIDKRFSTPLQKKLIYEAEDSLHFNLDEIGKNENFLIGELIRKSISEKFSIELSYLEISRIVDLGLSNKTGKKIVLKENVVVIKNQVDLSVSKQKKKNSSIKRIKVGESVHFDKSVITIKALTKRNIKFEQNQNPKIEYINGDLIEGDFELRYWKEGDFFYPLGMEQKKKISDFLTDRKVESSQKKNVFVLVNNNRIVWAIGYRISNLFKLNKETKNILLLQME